MKVLTIKITSCDDEPWAIAEGLDYVVHRIGHGQLKEDGDFEVFTYSYQLTTTEED
jgi:hypothetical protein